MGRKLYIHVGPMKTGTTAIQAVLAKHDGSTLLYPKVGIFRNAHHHLVFNSLGKRRQPPGCAKLPKGELLNAFANCTRGSSLNVLISSEWLGTHASRPETPAFIREIASRVAGGAPEVEILIACREHFDRAASVFGQKQKTGGRSAPNEFIRNNAAALCYAPIISALQQTGFSVTPLNYHPSNKWIARFFRHVGFSSEAVPSADSANQSFAPWILIARMAMNRILVTDDGPTELLRRKIIRRLKRLENSSSSAKFIFDREVATELEHTFGEDRRFLARNFQLELPSPDIISRENMFFLDNFAFGQIEQSLQVAGPYAQGMLDIVRRYVRE